MTATPSPVTLADLRAAIPAGPGRDWLAEAEATVRREPARIARFFPATGRHLGRAEIPVGPTRPADGAQTAGAHPAGGWTADAAGRAVLLTALDGAPGCGDLLADLYRYGDTAEKLAILHALPLVPGLRDSAPALLRDALRTNDTRLVGAALGPAADDGLDQETWRQGVLKCVFMGIPLSTVHRLRERADTRLGEMLAGLRDERTAAGRPLADDATELLAELQKGVS